MIFIIIYVLEKFKIYFIIRKEQTNMKKAILFIIFCITLFLAACGADEKSENTNGNDKEETVTITHEYGEEEVPKNPEKVVVFDFGILDTLDELGVEVAGVPQGSVPGYLEKYTGSEYINAGASREPDFEAISEIDPDLIIISDREAEVYEETKEIAPTIYLPVDFENYTESFNSNMETIATIFDKEDEMEKELKELNEKMDQVKGEVEKQEDEALIIMANEGKISAYGPGSRYGGIIHDVAGYKAADEGIEEARYGQNINFEYVVEKNPDIVFIVDRSAALDTDNTSTKEFMENKLFTKTNAYKNDQVVYLNMDAWFFGGGLQSMEMMIEDIDIY